MENMADEQDVWIDSQSIAINGGSGIVSRAGTGPGRLALSQRSRPVSLPA